MITLYTWTTPNGRKPAIMLEELGVPYRVQPVDIGKDEQFEPDFLTISPNNKIPALVDDEAEGGPLTLFESGAILTYLAEKHGRFLDATGPERYRALAWLYWQIGGTGPMFGQLGFFAMRAKEKLPLAIDHFTEEADRLLGVMDGHLAKNTYLAGEHYTIADMANYPWTLSATTYLQEVLADSMKDKPAVRRWLESVGRRPAVQRGMDVLKT
ncbi:MAG TPA: glutathione S-transferase N-terminal domain-containing protein [Oxalicibacterium sp.]|uniref:glutathione S-transferase family protein n=1 Tax=Oxalicibacterium sp. TaxID=2766525 RepID=UPI002CF1F50B|nr:glutathione S-transferase N-terminal domain-containing protein [Oxalicibacterium sp.]HWU97242.1 glutathione S-transferase N-terminal domain-containing protein [Oxalicibacterium sp.]